MTATVRSTLGAALVAASAGCGWNHLPDGQLTYFGAYWDANDVVPTVDGLYVRLLNAGAITLIGNDGSASRVDLGEGRVTRMDRAPDGKTVVAFVERYTCAPEDPKDAKRVERPEDCADVGAPVEITTELTLVSGGAVVSAQPVSGAYNQVAFSDDGRHAVAYLDFTQDLVVNEVLNLTGVVVVDLVAGTSQLVPVGFAADRVLFVEDDGGQAVQAVVVSRNAVALVDLLTDPPVRTTTFPLSLDPDTIVDPIGIDLTPDGRYALLSARGSSDLYALDLDVKAINIIELSGPPGAMAVDAPADRTVLVYPNQPTVDLLEHEFFDTTTLTLDEPMNQITLTGAEALLWTTAGHDLYRLDLDSTDLVEYRLQNPADALYLAPTGEFAVALTREEGSFSDGVDAVYDTHPGMEVVDLRTDDSEPFLLEARGLGVAFSSGGGALNALVLQQGIDYLYRLDLYSRETEEIELSAAPIAIGAMPDGRFYITHDRPLGLVSFLDPITGEITSVAGFATDGALDPIELMASGDDGQEGAR